MKRILLPLLMVSSWSACQDLFGEMDRMFSDMIERNNRIFNEFNQSMKMDDWAIAEKTGTRFELTVNHKQGDQALDLALKLPGVSYDQIDVSNPEGPLVVTVKTPFLLKMVVMDTLVSVEAYDRAESRNEKEKDRALVTSQSQYSQMLPEIDFSKGVEAEWDKAAETLHVKLTLKTPKKISVKQAESAPRKVTVKTVPDAKAK